MTPEIREIAAKAVVDIGSVLIRLCLLMSVAMVVSLK